MCDYLNFSKNPKIEDIRLLKYGRHFRYKNAKIIVGRNEIENKILLQIKKSNDLILETKNVEGPITIIQGNIDEEVIQFAAKLTLRYSDLKQNNGIIIYGKNLQNLDNEITIERESDEILKNYII